MQPKMQQITPCLWFDSQAEEAASFYTSVFMGSRIGRITHYGKEGHEIHGRPEGSVMAVEFERQFPGGSGKVLYQCRLLQIFL